MMDKALPLEQQLCFALYTANQAMGRLYRPMLSEFGLTYPQYLVLLALWDHKAMTVGELGKSLALESNTLTPLLKRMEAAGLLARRRSDEDERSVIVKLTAAGRELEAESHRLAECATRAADGGAADITGLRDQIFALAERLRAAS